MTTGYFGTWRILLRRKNSNLLNKWDHHFDRGISVEVKHSFIPKLSDIVEFEYVCDCWFQIWRPCGGRDDFWPLNQIRGVTSLQELWEGNGQGMHEGCGQSYGNGKGTENLVMTKNKTIWESLASWRRYLRGFSTQFKRDPDAANLRPANSSVPKTSVFRWTIQNIMTLTPPPVFWYWQSFYSLTHKCPWWW